MKKIIILFLLFLFSSVYSQVKWMNLEEAITAQAKNPRKIVINFYSDSCEPCKNMEVKTYNHPVIAKYLNENYYLVKFNAEGKESISLYGRTFINGNSTPNSLHDFAQFMNINIVPSTVFLDEKSKPITTLQGALTAKELEPYLIFIATNDYKKIESSAKWENYLKKFKSKIKD